MPSLADSECSQLVSSLVRVSVFVEGSAKRPRPAEPCEATLTGALRSPTRGRLRGGCNAGRGGESVGEGIDRWADWNDTADGRGLDVRHRPAVANPDVEQDVPAGSEHPGALFVAVLPLDHVERGNDAAPAA